MKIKVLAGSTMAIGLLGLGMLAGSVVGSSGTFAQTPSTTSTPGVALTAPVSPGTGGAESTSVTAKITQQQAEQTALAASPGNTVDHTSLQNQNGTTVYDVDFTNGGGDIVNGDTGVIIATEAAGQDKGGRGGRGGGADQAALTAKSTVTQQQAEQAALAASPGNTVDHSRLGDDNGTVFWDVDFANGGGVKVNAQTDAIIATEAAGADHGGHLHGPATNQP